MVQDLPFLKNGNSIKKDSNNINSSIKKRKITRTEIKQKIAMHMNDLGNRAIERCIEDIFGPQKVK